MTSKNPIDQGPFGLGCGLVGSEQLRRGKSTLKSLAVAKAEFWEQVVRASQQLEEEPLKIDARTTEIIASHFTLERQMELALEQLVAQPRELDRLGYGHKVAVLKALIGSLEMDRIGKQLLAFNELRNAAAHPRNPDLRPLIRKLHALLEEDQKFLSESDFPEEGDATLTEEVAPFLSPDETPILTYAAGIAGGLQAIVGAEALVRAALSGELNRPPRKQQRKKTVSRG